MVFYRHWLGIISASRGVSLNYSYMAPVGLAKQVNQKGSGTMGAGKNWGWTCIYLMTWI